MTTERTTRNKLATRERIPEIPGMDESSESETETEPAKAFHRRISTNRQLKTTKCIKEGYLMKHTMSFQRWRRKYFKLKGRQLYYAKNTESVIFDEIELVDSSIAECSVKNVNSSFQVITPFRNLVLCADSRKEMEEWILALRSAANRDYYETNSDQREMLSGYHNWYACSHARPTYCNVCQDSLSGVTSHGLSCEVCKFKAHKRCAMRAGNNCKWTMLASIGKDIIEEEDGTIAMPHQWMAGNLSVSAKCCVCEKTCGSVLRLQDWRCLWCKATVHTACREQCAKKCPLGHCRISILPPTAISKVDSDGFWRANKPLGISPLLVFVNSKSGDNQGVKMLRKFKQLLNPAQVFDLINGGPRIGLRLFQNFDSFRVLVCGGDGSIGWVLNEIDQLGLHKQCQVGVLPLGTGNDLARVLGWGGAFDDDTQLPQVLDKLEHAQIKMLDRWSTLTYEASQVAAQDDPISHYEDSVAKHLANILNSDSHGSVISSAKYLCETVKEFVAKVGHNASDEHEEVSISHKCKVLNEKLDALVTALNEESQASTPESKSGEDALTTETSALTGQASENGAQSAVAVTTPGTRRHSDSPKDDKDRINLMKASTLDLCAELIPDTVPELVPEADSETEPRDRETDKERESNASDHPDVEGTDNMMLDLDNLPPSDPEEGTVLDTEKDEAVEMGAVASLPPDKDVAPFCLPVTKTRKTKSMVFKPRDQLMSRANSLKKAIRQIIEDTERAVDEQNGLTKMNEKRNKLSLTISAPDDDEPTPSTSRLDSEAAAASTLPTLLLPGTPPNHRTPISPIPASPLSPTSPSSPFSAMEIQVTCVNDDNEHIMVSTEGSAMPTLSPPVMASMAHLSVPHFPYSSDGESSTCTTPGSLSPVQGVSPVLERKDFCSSSTPPTSPPKSPTLPSGPSRRISSISTCKSFFSPLRKRDKSPTKDASAGSSFPLLGMFSTLSGMSSNSLAGGLAGGSFISKVLLANADALCAAASPLMAEDVNIEEYQEKCVMNNYFGIGLDAKIALDFHHKREEHPEKCRSRTKNMMWFGMIGSKEIVNKTYKNLEQRVLLECDGQRIPLPNLQGLVVLNITSYMGGTNFWGGTKEGVTFSAPSFDDKILEVVAVFGSVQLGISRVLNIQRHRIAQCRSVKISILGDEGVPVQVDGEAWVQPPGYIRIVHKNRSQMLTRDKVFEEALKTWTEKHKIDRPVSPRHHMLSDEETLILQSFVEATEVLIKSVKVASICHTTVEQELYHLTTQASEFLERLYPSGHLAESPVRTQVSDLVSSVRTLYNETKLFLADKAAGLKMRADVEERLSGALAAMQVEMERVYEIGGLPHFQAIEEEASELHQKSKEKHRFGLMSRLMKHGKKEKKGEAEYTGPNIYHVADWSTEEVGQWLDSLGLGEYRNKFIANEIRGQELLSLGRTDLKDLGVSKVGHLKRVQQGIKDIKEKFATTEKSSSGM